MFFAALKHTFRQRYVKMKIALSLFLIFLVTSCRDVVMDEEYHKEFEEIPSGFTPVVIRTNFSDDSKWEEMKKTISSPVPPEGFIAYVNFVDSRELAGKNFNEIVSMVPSGYDPGYLFIADDEAFEDKNPSILVVEYFDGEVKSLRAEIAQVQSIENNLSISNMDFEEFAEAVSDDGIFRGF